MEKHPNISGEGYPHAKLELRMFIGCFSYTPQEIGEFYLQDSFFVFILFLYCFRGSLIPQPRNPNAEAGAQILE